MRAAHGADAGAAPALSPTGLRSSNPSGCAGWRRRMPGPRAGLRRTLRGPVGCPPRAPAPRGHRSDARRGPCDDREGSHQRGGAGSTSSIRSSWWATSAWCWPQIRPRTGRYCSRRSPHRSAWPTISSEDGCTGSSTPRSSQDARFPRRYNGLDSSPPGPRHQARIQRRQRDDVQPAGFSLVNAGEWQRLS